MDFQARVSAWAAVHLLAEKDVEAPFGLNAPVARIACEGSEPIDDLILTTDAGRTAYVQAKRTVSLSAARSRNGRLVPLASAVDQFVRQFVLGNTPVETGEDSSDAAHGRFVLAVGAGAPGTIRVTLREALERVRAYPGHELPSVGLGDRRSRALGVVATHIRASWTAATGSSPSDEDVGKLLSRLHVETIEVGEGERDERTVRHILRSSVLETPDLAAEAWSLLINEGLRLIRTRGHVDRARLLEVLSSPGVGVRAPRSYREDIQRLRDHSHRVTNHLGEQALIRLGGGTLRIQRPYVSLLSDTVKTGPVLVVGEPGVGKSGVLHSLAETLSAAGREVVVLAAQQPPFVSPGGLRVELRLDHDVVDVLANWPGMRPAFLIVDALDAARTEASAAALRTLIREVGERADQWNVVASIREYDARYSPDLALIFKGTPPAGSISPLTGGSFACMRHIVVGRLTDDELQQISELGAPRLAKLLESAPTEVATLLHNPFNLRLSAELLDGGTDPQAIRDVGSQLDLLDLYWRERVLNGGGGREASSREVVLRRAVEAMSRERLLHVDRHVVETEVAAGPNISDLLSEQVLIEWRPRPEDPPRRSTLAFSHHVLFDYAVARLLLRRDARRLADFLAGDPGFVLLGRPSLVMHFHYLRALDPPRGTQKEFWEAALAVCGGAGIPEIGKLIGPSVAAEIGWTIREFSPLLMALSSAQDTVRESAENALEYVTPPLLSERGSQPEVVSLCSGLAARLSACLTVRSAYPTSWILSELVPQLDRLSVEQAKQLGTASRRLLAFAWAQSPRDQRLVGRAIQVSCQTIGTDVGASSALLRRAVEPDHLAQHGSEELRWLARAVPSITPHAPDLVRDIYGAAFGYREASEAPTSLTGGTVLPLTSTRRQDYRSALYQLVESYPEFLRTTPQEAVEAMNSALEWYVTIEQSSPERKAVELDLNGEAALLRPDHSHLWDEGRGHHDEYAIQLLDRVQQRLESLAGHDGGAVELACLVDTLVRTCELAVVWRRLLGLGARYPTQIGNRIRAAGSSLAVLNCPDTSTEAGKMNAALFSDLAEADRERIELAILSIPEAASPEGRSWSERRRDRLLKYLPEDRLVLPESRDHLSALVAEGAVPLSDDDVTSGFSIQAYEEAEHLASQGVPVEEEPNKRLRELEIPVKGFVNVHENKAPGSEELAEALPHMRRLYTALQSAQADGAHQQQADYAWGTLAQACAAAANMENFRCDSDAGAFVRTVLLEASGNRLPDVGREADESFVDPMWGSPAARLDAAAGLMTILRHSSCGDSDVLSTVERLGADPAPCVRYQIACRLMFRYAHDPDWTWRMIDRMARDHSLGVLRGLVKDPLSSLVSREPRRVAEITINIRQAAADGPDRAKLVNPCGDVLAHLFVWGRDAAASALIDGLASDPVAQLEEVAHLVNGCREILVAGTVEPPDPEVDAARRRSWSFLERVVKGVAAEFRSGVKDEGKIRALARVLDSAGWNIFFASGAKDCDESPGELVLRRFYAESGEVIDDLADVGLPQLSHNLLHALEVLVPIDPPGVFRRVARVISGGRKGGYQYDSLADEVIVRIVDRYLADHRELFRRDEEARRHLVAILDTLVHAGSESARRLSFGLDGIFR